jgi:hypothetical protein
MPDTIPDGSMTIMDVTGDHWSSRWWANYASQIVEEGLGTPGPPGPLGPPGPVGPAGPPGTGSTGNSASMSSADLKNTPPSEGMVVAIDDPGREGFFQWQGQNHSAFMEVEAILSSATTPIVPATGKITKIFHNLDTGSGVYLKTAVNGLTAYTLYWVIRTDIVTSPPTATINTSDKFQLATSLANAKAGVFIVLSGSTQMTLYRHADPYEGRFIMKNGTKCDGSEGAWVRMVPDESEYNAGWWGLDREPGHHDHGNDCLSGWRDGGGACRRLEYQPLHLHALARAADGEGPRLGIKIRRADDRQPGGAGPKLPVPHK